MQANPSELPKVIGETTFVTAKELKEKRIAEEKLPIHEAHKENDKYGKYIKKEMFIFDGFEKALSSEVIRVKREDEFAPLKNKDGIDSPATAVELYNNKYC